MEEVTGNLLGGITDALTLCGIVDLVIERIHLLCGNGDSRVHSGLGPRDDFIKGLQAPTASP
jgi:hypothetical protein